MRYGLLGMHRNNGISNTGSSTFGVMRRLGQVRLRWDLFTWIPGKRCHHIAFCMSFTASNGMHSVGYVIQS